MLKKWDDLPQYMKTEAVRPYYEFLKKKQISLLFKRVFDFVISLILFMLFFPLYIVIPIVIVIDSRGNPFFSQIRITQYGKKFKIYKFRTMKIDAEELKNKFTEEEKKEYEENQKLQKDNRVTRIGKFLRRTSLDELPQLWNILKGDMTFTGPRPIVEMELERYQDKKEEFLSLKPGLIGYWQAYSDKSTTYQERMEMELYYVKNESFGFDVKIFLKSIVTVIRKAINTI